MRQVIEGFNLLAGNYADFEMLDNLIKHVVAFSVVHVKIGFQIRDVVLPAHLLVELLCQVRRHRALRDLMTVIRVLASRHSLHLVRT